MKNIKSFLNIASYFTMRRLILLLFLASFLSLIALYQARALQNKKVLQTKAEYWFLLKRKSNIENFYLGKPGDEVNSKLVRTFSVKTGIPGEKPTPLPKLLGKKYWLITDKFDAKDYPETAPYFLKLDVPVTEEYPFGPVPYEECIYGQCNWEIPGYFGLHGVNGDFSRLSVENLGSSGCIRHKDEDITYLFNLLDPQKNNVKYYIEDI